MGGGLANSRHAPLSAVGPYKSISASASSSDFAPRRTFLPPGRPQSTPLETINPALVGSKSSGGNARDGLASPTLELVRFTRIVRRLKWKLPFLAAGYGSAVNRLGQDRAQVEEAELMFKLDFFEFYALIERALVHLMGVFGIHITAAMQPPRRGVILAEGRNDASSPGESSGFNYHAYHENVLSALDDPRNPLHRVLGTAEVRKQLSRAKELRNLWKTAGELSSERDQTNQRWDGGNLRTSRWATKKVAAPLESYRLNEILDTIFAAFDKAFIVSQRFVETGRIELPDDEGRWPFQDGDVDMVDWSIAAAVAAGEDLSDDEGQWNFMTDAMDWEAI